MPRMITYGSEKIRIGERNRIEYSKNGSLFWSSRCTRSSYGEFRDLRPYGSELLAITSKGIYYSENSGRSWSSRCTSSSYGEFLNFVDGEELLVATSKGLYHSKDSGSSWSKQGQGSSLFEKFGSFLLEKTINFILD